MSAAERVAGWFVAPAGASGGAGSVFSTTPAAGAASAPQERLGPRASPPVEPPTVGTVPPLTLAPPPPPSPAADASRGIRVCVLGPERETARFAAALAARLARRPGARCAVFCSATLPGHAASAGPPAPAARRVARGLTLDGHRAEVVGRVVRVGLPDAPAAVALTLAAVAGSAAGAPVVTVLPGVRSAALDALLFEQDVVLAVVPDGVDATLAALVVAELEALVPGAVVRPIALLGRPSAAARRRAVTFGLEAVG